MPQTLKQNHERMQRWYQTRLGQHILELETERTVQLCQQQRAHYILSMGGTPRQLNRLAASDARVEYIALDELQPKKPHPLLGTLANARQLRPNSFDHIVLSHMLEGFAAAIPLLSDCNQLLAADGYISIYTFNPWSLWGLARLFPGSKLPWPSKLHNTSTLQQWLEQLGMQIISTNSFCFRPPIQKTENFQRYSWLERFGRYAWPYCGSVVSIVAQKTQLATPSKLKAWAQKSFTQQETQSDISNRSL